MKSPWFLLLFAAVLLPALLALVLVSKIQPDSPEQVAPLVRPVADEEVATTTTTAPTTTSTALVARKVKRMTGEWPWDALAACESGGDWSYNGPSGFDGGLQFHPRTWSAYAPPHFPTFAYEATRDQQIAVAQLVLADQGWGAWPACSRKLGLR